MKKCIKCGKEIADDAVFCNWCGEKQPASGKQLKNSGLPVQRSETSRRIAEKQTETPTKKSHTGRRFVAVLLSLALLFTGFVKPGFIRTKLFPGGENTETMSVPSAALKPSQSSDSGKTSSDTRELSTEKLVLSEKDGNSKAFRYSPLDGIEVSAEEGAFDEDTEIKISPVTEADGIILDTVGKLEEEGVMVVAAYEVDAGLDGDAQIPGVYTVSIDLKKAGIPESLWEELSAYRVAKDGSYYEYASYVENGMLTYSSDQNSFVFVTIRFIAYALVLYFSSDRIKKLYDDEFNAPFKYYYDAKKQISTISRSTKYAKYRIHWNMEDLVPDAKALLDELERISEAYTKKADQIYKEYEENRQFDAKNILDIFSRNKSVAEVLMETIEKDPEYQKAAKKLNCPEEVEYCIKCVDLAFQYLKEDEFMKLPTGVIEISSVKTLPSGVLGSATARLVHESYVEVNLTQLTNAVQEKKENFLLTMTHELLHVCQAVYRYPWADANRYDEMVAVYAEPRMLLHYRAKGYIGWDSNPELSASNHWMTLKLPVDAYYGKDEGITLRYEGYNLGAFLTFLQEKTGETLWLGKIARAKDKIKEGGISKPLMKVFGISEAEFDTYYRLFMRENKEAAGAHYDAAGPDRYKRTDPVRIEKGGRYHVDVTCEGSYSSEIKGFIQKAGSNIALIVVPDKGFRKTRTECDLVPVDKFEIIKKGAYIYPQTYAGRDILEVHGALGKTDPSARSGFTLYAADKTGSVTAGEDKDDLIITMPKNSALASDGVLGGYMLTVEFGDGEKIERKVAPEEFGQEIRIPKKDIYKKRSEKDPFDVHMTLCEFVMKTDEEYILLEPSDVVTYTLNETVPVLSDGYIMSTMLHNTDILNDAWLSTSVFLEEALRSEALVIEKDGTFSGEWHASYNNSEPKHAVNNDIFPEVEIIDGETPFTPVAESSSIYQEFVVTMNGKIDMKTGKGTASMTASYSGSYKWTEWDKEGKTRSGSSGSNGHLEGTTSQIRIWDDGEQISMQWNESGSDKLSFNYTITHSDYPSDVGEVGWDITLFFNKTDMLP